MAYFLKQDKISFGLGRVHTKYNIIIIIVYSVNANNT